MDEVQKLLQDFFDGTELQKSLHPDEAVAQGAALLVVKLTGRNVAETEDLMLLEVTRASLSTEGASMGERDKAEEHKEGEEKEKSRMEAMNSLEVCNVCTGWEMESENMIQMTSKEYRKDVMTTCEEAMK
ncbi:unnamed protein product [Taenia asiatica]|uniref:Dynein light chain n=1 Tax=Taenia asiatica TaxID=60517 RepID=A0A0R3VSW1_TAEAS|nr:unnamed protein product [Taenia asiatica]